MDKIAIIGAGISGLTTAHLLNEKGYQTTIFEKESQPGGLIRCQYVNNSLFHICGGHVFNSKRQDVLDWFWSQFNKQEEFVMAERNAVVCMDNEKLIPYPIENHMYHFESSIQEKIISDWLTIVKHQKVPQNFEDFLLFRFGNTLYDLYFKPYNEKIWRRNLNTVPLSWLEGKLPMPSVSEMIYNNINHIEEKSFVHSTFWYEKNGGSQYLADRLSQGLDIKYNTPVSLIQYQNGKWIINGLTFERIVYCGNIREIPLILKGLDIKEFTHDIQNLEYHGTTSVFCEIDKNPYSWIYQPSKKHLSHRIICTGNFSKNNNASGILTATIEFTDYISKEDIIQNLQKIPFHPKYLTHHYNQYTYPIQDTNTRNMIKKFKLQMKDFNFFSTGRFADWEYYNMDAAMGAAIDLVKQL